jgi:hypothetical protein
MPSIDSVIWINPWRKSCLEWGRFCLNRISYRSFSRVCISRYAFAVRKTGQFGRRAQGFLCFVINGVTLTCLWSFDASLLMSYVDWLYCCRFSKNSSHIFLEIWNLLKCASNVKSSTSWVLYYSSYYRFINCPNRVNTKATGFVKDLAGLCFALHSAVLICEL